MYFNDVSHRIMFVLVGCGDSSDEAKSMTSLKGTTWEGSLSNYINGAEQHTFVTVKFTGDHATPYSYNGGGSDFSYVVSGVSLSFPVVDIPISMGRGHSRRWIQESSD